MKRFPRWTAIVVLLLSLPASETVGAGEFTPPELFDYEEVRFKNGFSAILNPRGTAKNVSMRIIVGVGHEDFPCKDAELPHFAEHLIYAGTSAHSEGELEGLISNWGGTWNAFTWGDRTVYELDIYSANIQDGIKTHYQMFTDLRLSEEKVDIVREIIHAESGGRPNWIREFLHEHAIGDGAADEAYRKFVPGTRSVCTTLPNAEHIDLTDIQSFLAEYYQPDNMIIVVVGDFDRDIMIELLKSTFGSIPGSGQPRKHEPVRELRAQPVEYHTSFDPILASETYVSLEFQVPLGFGEEAVALGLISEYLSEELYDRLRTQRGWAYTPEVGIQTFRDFGTLVLQAEVPTNRVSDTFRLFEALVREVHESGVPEDRLNDIKKGLLLSQLAAYEANSQFSDFYAGYIEHYWQNGRFPDMGSLVLLVDASVARRVAKQYLNLDNAMYYYAAPTLSYSQLGGVVFSLFALPVGLVFARRYWSAREY
jgi:predicted Zn-dependent peptidase